MHSLLQAGLHGEQIVIVEPPQQQVTCLLVYCFIYFVYRSDFFLPVLRFHHGYSQNFPTEYLVRSGERFDSPLSVFKFSVDDELLHPSKGQKLSVAYGCGCYYQEVAVLRTEIADYE